MPNVIKGIAPHGKALFARDRRPSYEEACGIATEPCQPRPITNAQALFGSLMAQSAKNFCYRYEPQGFNYSAISS
ncbi:MAG: hypothetical protein M3270_04650 [Thermoproteota archaeon]|nr:hypothetical protein [Thermoproteota archaeon]